MASLPRSDRGWSIRPPLVALRAAFPGRVRDATLRRQPVDDVQRGAVPRPLRRRRARPASTAWSSCFPYDHPTAEITQAAGRERPDPGAVQHAARATGPRASAAWPACPVARAEFRDGVKQALDYAGALDCKLVHCMAGIVPAGVSPVTAASVYAANLAWAAEQAHAGRREAGDRADQPPRHAGLFPEHPGAGRRGRRGHRARPARPAVRRLSCARSTEGDITKRMEQFMPVIAHMQIADVPARNEPGTGEIGWRVRVPTDG